jgi:zinc transport system ATP-binding protein
MSKALAELSHIHAGYNGHPVLKDINLTVSEQDFLGITGPNGGGKTTLLRVILRLLKPTSGSLRPADKDLKNKTGYMPQINLIDKQFPILVSEAVAFGLISGNDLSKEQKKEKTIRIMEEMGLSGIQNKPVGELSGGQLQRVLLARAIVNDPQLLILDEPNSYVDKRFEGHFYDLLQKINGQTAIILVSHNLEAVASLLKNIAFVNETLQYYPGPDIKNALTSLIPNG